MLRTMAVDAGSLVQPACLSQMLILLGGSTPYFALNAVIAGLSPLISVKTLASWALTRALPRAGRISAAKRAMITITTISSMRVNARRKEERRGIKDEGREIVFMAWSPGTWF